MAAEEPPEVWKAEVLAKHNELRARHSAPPLKWSDECFQLAKKQSKVCAKVGDCEHGHQKGTFGPHGQNVGYPMQSAAKAVQHWYNELIKWVYDFEDHNSEASHMCEHFTQVIWADTEYVGMAVTDGYMVANYFPSGNREKFFADNVFPAPLEAIKAAYPCRTIWFDSYSPELNDFLHGCEEYISPSNGRGAHQRFVQDVEKGLSQGAKVRIVREGGHLCAAVRAGTSYCKYDQELVKKSWKAEHESLWDNLPKAYLQFKDCKHFRVPDRIRKRQSTIDAERPAQTGVLAGVKAVFQKADANGDGYLSGEELTSVLVALGMNPKESSKLIKAADRNGDGRVELDEFLTWIFGGTKKAQEALSKTEAASIAEEATSKAEKASTTRVSTAPPLQRKSQRARTGSSSPQKKVERKKTTAP